MKKYNDLTENCTRIHTNAELIFHRRREICLLFLFFFFDSHSNFILTDELSITIHWNANTQIHTDDRKYRRKNILSLFPAEGNHHFSEEKSWNSCFFPLHSVHKEEPRNRWLIKNRFKLRRTNYENNVHILSARRSFWSRTSNWRWRHFSQFQDSKRKLVTRSPEAAFWIVWKVCMTQDAPNVQHSRFLKPVSQRKSKNSSSTSQWHYRRKLKNISRATTAFLLISALYSEKCCEVTKDYSC